MQVETTFVIVQKCQITCATGLVQGITRANCSQAVPNLHRIEKHFNLNPTSTLVDRTVTCLSH